MVLGSIVSSPRGSLSPQQTLELANVYLDNACKANDPDIALVLCHDTEISLSQAKKGVKKLESQTTVTQGITAVYIDLGKLLESLNHASEAQAIFKKAEKLGGNTHDSDRHAKSSSSNSTMQLNNGVSQLAASSLTVGSLGSPPLVQDKQRRTSAMVPEYIFDVNVCLPTNKFQLPKADERLDNTPQLVFCLGLLRHTHSPDDSLEPAAQKWLQVIEKNTDEQERLHAMATDVLRAFKRDELKDAKTIAEVVRLSPVLDKDAFHDLLREFYTGIDHSGLLNFHQLEGLAQLIQGADPDHLNSDDLVKILGLLSTRLMDTHQRSSHHMRQLTLAVSHVLDAMADTKVIDLTREKLHEPLSSYLDELKKSDDPFLVYQAAYAYQALLCVPDDETTWQSAMRRTGKVIQGVSGMASALKGFDLAKFIAGLEDIQKGFDGAVKTVGAAYDRVTSLVGKGQGLMESLKEGFSFHRKRDWYSALRGADVLIQDGELATFKKLICEAPCRYDPAFQWGVCQRLGEIAANPMWDENIRRGAIAFMKEIYTNDEMWGQQSSTKYWILDILMQLSLSTGRSSQLHTTAASSLLHELETISDAKKQSVYQAWKENGPTSYPLKVTLPELASPSLLDRVQNRPDVEGNIRLLRKQRANERGNVIYIQPQAKPSLQTSDDTRFPLMDKVKEFLDSDRKVFLLLGDSGAGKSTFSRELELELWQSYKNKADRIPLHINLPTIDKPEHDMIAKQLRKAEFSEPQIREMKHHRRFILICDGYDECLQTHNLYMSNQLNQPDGWDAQMVISCRSEYVGSDYRDQFQPGDRNHRLDSPLFQEAVLTQFSPRQVQDYIKQYVSINQPLWRVKDYEQVLDLTPSLKDLVKNPFMMALSLDVLPRMVDPGQHLSSTRVTRTALYDHFVEHWLERGKKRLGEKDMSSQTKEAFEKLSTEGFTLNGIGYIKKFAAAIYKEQDGHPVVEYTKLRDEGSWKDDFFGDKENQLLHQACPLRRDGNQHRFIHRSLLEYGLARAVFDPQDTTNRAASGPASGRRGSVSSIMSFEIDVDKENKAYNLEQDPDANSPLVWRSFVHDHSLMQFLEERVRQEPMFKQQLLSYIHHSKGDKKWRTAAANAITILVRVGVQFSDEDFRGIRIPGADLSYGVFDSVQLQGADMRKVNLRGAWLRQTDLRGADLTSVQFGELPYITVYHINIMVLFFELRRNPHVPVTIMLQYFDFIFNSKACAKSCAYSPDGKLLAFGFNEGAIAVCRTLGDWKLQSLKGRHRDEIQSVAFSPKGDLITSASRDKTIQLWDVSSGESIFTLTDHTEAVNCVVYSPRGDRIASASDDKTLRLWDPATGHCCQVLSGHESEVLCVTYSPKGDLIVSGSADSAVRLWISETGECSHIFIGHSDEVWGIAFSPRGDQLASCSNDKTIRLWDLKTGVTFKVLSGHTSKVSSIAYSPQGDRIASGSHDSTVRVWDVASGICCHTWTGHNGVISSVAYSPDGNLITSCGMDKTIRLWDVSVEASQHVPSGHSQDVTKVKCSPKGDLIASCSSDASMRFWSAETGACCGALGGHSGPVTSVAFSPQGNRIVSSNTDNTVRIWDMEAGACQHVLSGHTDSVNGVAYSPRGNQIASCSKDKTIRLWDVSNGDCSAILIGCSGEAACVVYSPDGRCIATGNENHTVQLWDVGAMACRSTLVGHGLSVLDVEFSPQGSQLASASKDGSVRLWNVETGRCCSVLTGHIGIIISVAYSHKGDLLATGGWDRTVRLWDVASGKCREVIKHFRGEVRSLAWSAAADANYLVTGCPDGSIIKWQVMEEGKWCRTRLCWSATNGSLNVRGASIEGVHGLSLLNRRLLSQRESGGETRRWFDMDITVKVILAFWRHLPRFLTQDPGYMGLAFIIGFITIMCGWTILMGNVNYFIEVVSFFPFWSEIECAVQYLSRLVERAKQYLSRIRLDEEGDQQGALEAEIVQYLSRTWTWLVWEGEQRGALEDMVAEVPSLDRLPDVLLLPGMFPTSMVVAKNDDDGYQDKALRSRLFSFSLQNRLALLMAFFAFLVNRSIEFGFVFLVVAHIIALILLYFTFEKNDPAHH